MGYYTKYEIEVWPDDKQEAVVEKLSNDYLGRNPFDGEIKWYEHEEHLQGVSLEFPDALITVDGEGEGTGDKWRLFARNGEIEKHKMPEWEPPTDPKTV